MRTCCKPERPAPPARHLTLLWVALAVFLMASHGTAQAGWRLDAGRYFESSHAEVACGDCHGEIDSLARHPDPLRVNDTPGHFDPETCAQCHDEVTAEIQEGVHGGESVADPERFSRCVDCHDPHYPNAPEQAGKAKPPDPQATDAACMACHLDRGPALGVESRQKFCFTCHKAPGLAPGGYPVMDAHRYAATAHARMDCLACHPDSGRYGHQNQASRRLPGMPRPPSGKRCP